jgi:SH3-like domain-containing protein
VNLAKVIRAVVGVVVVVALGIVVMNYYNDFKAARASAPAMPSLLGTTQTTASASATTTLGVGVARIDGVNFRVKPASSAKLIRGLKKGEKVTVLLKDGQWYQVKDSKGKIGWVTSNADYVALEAH